MCCLKWRFVTCYDASREGSDQSAHLHMLTLTFVTVKKSHVLPQMAMCHVLLRQQQRLWRVCTFALVTVTESHVLPQIFGESEHLHRLTLAFITVTESHVLPQMAICHVSLRQQRRLWRVCTFAQVYLSLSHSNRISCSAQMAICHSLLRQPRRLWRVCTFAQAYLSLRHSNRISCAATNGDVSRVITPAKKALASLYICAGLP